MPWEESSQMNEKAKFIARLLEGEKMSHLCSEFNISRKTGHKLRNRYEEEGPIGLYEKSRAPKRKANLINPLLEKVILKIKKEKPHWGAGKIREIFIRRHSDIYPPAKSTFHAIFERQGLVKKRRKRMNKYKAKGTSLGIAKEPNDLWCADFKGEFYLSGSPRKYCYPLTISDSVSRYLISCEALESTKAETSFPVFERAFKEYGLPEVIRTDNGTPFSSPMGLFGLSALSVYWLRLGIKIERIRPGHPEENGRHERMHRTMKKEATKPSGVNFLQQQEKFDNFVDEYNKERPHEALNMKTPAEMYKASIREYKGLPEISYPLHEQQRWVSKNGSLRISRKANVYISMALIGQPVGLTEVDDGIWKVTFMDYDIGCFDEDSYKLAPLENPLEKVLPMSPV